MGNIAGFELMSYNSEIKEMRASVYLKEFEPDVIKSSLSSHVWGSATRPRCKIAAMGLLVLSGTLESGLSKLVASYNSPIKLHSGIICTPG